MEAITDKARSLFEDALKDKKKLIKIMTVAVILLLALIFRIAGSSEPDIAVENAEAYSTDEIESEDSEEIGEYVSLDNLYVDISGAVNSPGVYSVSSKTRLYEVVEMAGGLTDKADINSINQASFVEDGEKIIIPEKGEEIPAANSEDDSSLATSSSSGIININLASKEELKTLNGIGDAIAERIIQYRATRAFRSKEDIMSVDGIGSKIYEKIKDNITV